MFGLAGLLFVIGIAPAPSTPAHPTTPFLKGIRSLSLVRRITFLVLLFGGIAAAIGSVPLFVSLSAQPEINQGWLINTGSWLLYVLALVMFGAAWAVWEFKRPDIDVTTGKTVDAMEAAGRGSIHPLYSGLIMLALLVLGLSLRLPGLDSVPAGLWFDEAQNGIVGRDLLAPDALHLRTFRHSRRWARSLLFIWCGCQAIWRNGNMALALFARAGRLTDSSYAIHDRLQAIRVAGRFGCGRACGSGGMEYHHEPLRAGIAPDCCYRCSRILVPCTGTANGPPGLVRGGRCVVGPRPPDLLPCAVGAYCAGAGAGAQAHIRSDDLFRSVRAGMLAFAVAALITFIPVATFAVQHTDQFTQRAQTISIFRR